MSLSDAALYAIRIIGAKRHRQTKAMKLVNCGKGVSLC